MFNKALITKRANLWLLFGLTIFITLVFQVLSRQFDMIFIDNISSQDEVRKILADMTSGQKSLHAWITGTLDVVYPFAYGFFFIGTALLFFPEKGKYLAVPALLAITADLTEGVIQILALTDTADLLAVKSFVTPAKLLFFLCGFIIAAAGWSKWLYHRFVKNRKEETD